MLIFQRKEGTKKKRGSQTKRVREREGSTKKLHEILVIKPARLVKRSTFSKYFFMYLHTYVPTYDCEQVISEFCDAIYNKFFLVTRILINFESFKKSL